VTQTSLSQFLLISLCVSVGGALGALTRFVLGELLSRGLQTPAFASIMLINVLGSFAIGYLLLLLEARYRKDGKTRLHSIGFEKTLDHHPGLFREDLTLQAVDYFSSNQKLRIVSGFFITGFLGGFTTFSSYMLYAIRLIEKGEILNAFINTVLSIVLGLLAVFAGMTLAHHRLKKSKAAA
jgi:CrcB protein